MSHFVSGDDGIFLDLWRAPGELAMSGLSPFASPLDGVEGGSPARCVCTALGLRTVFITAMVSLGTVGTWFVRPRKKK